MSSSCMYRVGLKALIYNEQKQLLLTYEDRKGMRDLPGGGLEHHTDLIDGLMQEIQEELGSDIGDIVIDAGPVVAWPCMINDFGLFLIAYRVDIDISRIKTTDENQKRGFFSQEDIKGMKLYTNPYDIDQLFS